MRTTKVDVRGVIATGLEDSEIQILIDLANRQVTSTLSSAGFTDAVLKDIETWLAAHFIAITKERQTEEERVDDIWVLHQGKFGKGLQGTTFGQMVLMLDTSGSFATTGKQKMKFIAIPQDPDSPTHDA